MIRWLVRLLRNRPDRGLHAPVPSPVPLRRVARDYVSAGARVRYTTPLTYDEARAVSAARAARETTERGTPLRWRDTPRPDNRIHFRKRG